MKKLKHKKYLTYQYMFVNKRVAGIECDKFHYHCDNGMVNLPLTVTLKYIKDDIYKCQYKEVFKTGFREYVNIIDYLTRGQISEKIKKGEFKSIQESDLAKMYLESAIKGGY